MRISDWSSDVCSSDLYVTVERLLLAIALASRTDAARALKEAGVTPQALEHAIQDLRKGRTADSSNAEGKFDALKKYTRDRTEAARRGTLDPVIGSADEITRTPPEIGRATCRGRGGQ